MTIRQAHLSFQLIPSSMSHFLLGLAECAKRSATPYVGRAQRVRFSLHATKLKIQNVADLGKVVSLSLPLQQHRAFRRADQQIARFDFGANDFGFYRC